MSTEQIRALAQQFIAAKRAADAAVHDEVAAQVEIEGTKVSRDAAVGKMNAGAAVDADQDPHAFSWSVVKEAAQREASYRNAVKVHEQAVKDVASTKDREIAIWELLVKEA